MSMTITQFSEVQSLRVFFAIVEGKSLAAAARALDVTSSALSQRLRQLEIQLGVRLLDRDTRKLQLTEEGRLLYERGRDLIGNFDKLIGEVCEKRVEIAGQLNVFAPLGFGRAHVAPLMAHFHNAHPNVDVSLTLGDRIAGHAQERFDLVIHIGDLQASSAIAYPIAPNARLLCASPAYLASTPPLDSPDDLIHHRCLVLRENDEDVTMWQFHRGANSARVRVTPALSTNDGDVIRQWAIAGRGLIVRSEWHVAENIARGELVRVLPDWTLPPADVVALAPHRAGMPTRVRSLLEFLQAHFQPTPPWRVV